MRNPQRLKSMAYLIPMSHQFARILFEMNSRNPYSFVEFSYVISIPHGAKRNSCRDI